MKSPPLPLIERGACDWCVAEKILRRSEALGGISRMIGTRVAPAVRAATAVPAIGSASP